ncbi:MAG: metalloregulator ArsR/SmtB family transcription factor [Chloroflexota bacterium]|jgi:DNA-binding transcriptional ArsR family regulator|nr:metalloregulator ArsR/SmtB family transcription factor [Chloroflexota bacterium]
MGELVAGRPALHVDVVVSLPLDLISTMSLLYRAVPGSGLDPWLVATRRSLPPALREDIDLLHGFSGRLLYYLEEPIMRFAPLRPERLDATFAELFDFLVELPPVTYRAMALHALDRVHRDLGTSLVVPANEDESAWRRYLEPGLTTATGEEAYAILREPEALRDRTLRLLRGVWEQCYRDEYVARLPAVREAARRARVSAGRGFGVAFSELTGKRLPSTLAAGLHNVSAVTFCPSYHLGGFISYIIYPPDVIVYFSPALDDAASLVANDQAVERATAPNGERNLAQRAREDVLEGLRALADPNRLRILDLLGSDELYAQEIVGRLGIAQSAVSRHLAQLERAGLLTVRPRGGMKYYAIDQSALTRIAGAIEARVGE